MKKSSKKENLLKVGDHAPDFTLPSHNEGELNLKWYEERQNVVLAFYPGDWTPACSSQIPGYEEKSAKFLRYNCQVLGISVDSTPSHKAWAASLGGISFPLLSDYWPHGQVTQQYGVFSERGFAERTVFLIDINGIIRFIGRYDYEKVPDIDELFRQIEKLDSESTTAFKSKSFPG
ncbi:MAG: redoxin domain-containing protein [Candidatus Zixiibacteriota bacterium]